MANFANICEIIWNFIHSQFIAKKKDYVSKIPSLCKFINSQFFLYLYILSLLFQLKNNAIYVPSRENANV